MVVVVAVVEEVRGQVRSSSFCCCVVIIIDIRIGSKGAVLVVAAEEVVGVGIKGAGGCARAVLVWGGVSRG